MGLVGAAGVGAAAGAVGAAVGADGPEAVGAISVVEGAGNEVGGGVDGPALDMTNYFKGRNVKKGRWICVMGYLANEGMGC